MALPSLIKRRMPSAGHQPKLAVASLHRRFLASLIDALVGVFVAVSVIATGVLAFALGRKRGIDSKLLRDVGSSGPDVSRRLGSRPVKLALHLITFAVSASYKQRRSPGFRLLGLQLVDARTGGELSRQQEVIRHITRQAWSLVCRQLISTPKVQASLDHERLKSEIQAAQDRCAGDSDALQHEIIRIHSENKVHPARISCLPALVRPLLIAAIDLPAFWSPLKQSLPDRLAGIVTIRD